MNNGFLGPIGDDLPSLIPLLFALLIFFSTFSFSYSVFSQKNLAFERDIDVLGIARVLKGTSYVSGFKAFEEACNSLNPTNLSYYVFVTNFFTASKDYCSKYDCPQELCLKLVQEDSFFVCHSEIAEQLKVFEIKPFVFSDGLVLECPFGGSLPVDPESFFSQNFFISKIYPLVVEDERVVKPMHLVVIAWEK